MSPHPPTLPQAPTLARFHSIGASRSRAPLGLGARTSVEASVQVPHRAIYKWKLSQMVRITICTYYQLLCEKNVTLKINGFK